LPAVSIVWAVPVVAAAVAAGLVAAHARRLEDAGTALAREVGRLSELRAGLAALRSAAQETDARVATFRARHAVTPVEASPGGSTTGDHTGGDGTGDGVPRAGRRLRIVDVPDGGGRHRA
jgi:hypothetical protein